LESGCGYEECGVPPPLNEVVGGIYGVGQQRSDGTWDEEEWTGTGFPRVFYLRYHYYRHYWPQMALAQYLRYLRGYRP